MIRVAEVGSAIVDFFLSVWLWNITFDLNHIVLVSFIMFFLLKVTMRISFLRAFIISVATQLISFLTLTALVVGVIMHLMGWEYVSRHPLSAPIKINVLRACLSLALIYGIFNTIFLVILRFYGVRRAVPYITIAWISNVLAALLSAMSISLFMWYAV